MNDNEITKTAEGESNTSGEKIKAIYPHITISGTVYKPYYSIDWYDIEKQEMHRGYSSFNLQFVHKWLQENFEVVDDDIDNLINRYEAKIKKIEGKVVIQKGLIDRQKAEIERFKEGHIHIDNFARNICNERLLQGKAIADFDSLRKYVEREKAEAVKEFAEKVVIELTANYSDKYCHWIDDTIDNLVKEMVGETQ